MRRIRISHRVLDIGRRLGTKMSDSPKPLVCGGTQPAGSVMPDIEANSAGVSRGFCITPNHRMESGCIDVTR